MTETVTSITWLTNWDDAVAEARANKKPILIDVYQDDCGGCIRLDQETFRDPEIIREVNERFVPIKLHLSNDRAVVREWGLLWTPTVLFADRSGKIRYESVNFLPPEQFIDVLDIGEARVAMRWRELETAIQLLKDVQERHPDGPLTAEAIYWRGMAEYFLEKNNPATSKRVWAEISERFPDSIWAKRQP
jgi:thioredoxin-related protein